MSAEVFYEKYRKLSVAALTTGILAVIFCMLYFLLWALFDDFLTVFIADHGFMSYIMFSYVSIGVCLTIAAIVTGGIDLKKIKTGINSRKGRGLDITGITLGSILALFGFTIWFIDFFGFINIIS
jgi:hypothetical protein